MYQFKEINRKQWNEYWCQIQFANLMQSWEYGEAKRCQRWKPIRYVVLDSENKPLGLLQVLFRGMSLLGGVARINRGPVLFQDPFNLPLDVHEVYMLWLSIRRLGKANRWWIIASAPEIPVGRRYDDLYLRVLGKAGFTRKNNLIPWGSARLSLKSSQKELLMALKKKWRYLLQKGKKTEIEVENVVCKKEVFSLIDIYEIFQKEQKFTGIPSLLLKALYSQSGDGFCFKVYKTVEEDVENVSGFIFVIYHGDTAIYLVGWSSDIGRKKLVNYLLLWDAIEDAKAEGLQWFDIGGLNENTTKGIAHFKSGINGSRYQLIGEFK